MQGPEVLARLLLLGGAADGAVVLGRGRGLEAHLGLPELVTDDQDVALLHAEGKWNKKFELESQCTPAILPIGSGGRRAVIACIGAAAGYPPAEKEDQKLPEPTGDRWEGRILAFDVADGTQLWSFEPPVWDKHAACGFHCGESGSIVPSPAFTCPTMGPGGKLLVVWQGGLLYGLDAATGAKDAEWDCTWTGFCNVALAPSALVLNTAERLHVFRTPQPKARVIRELDLPYSETGTNHFWPMKNGPNYYCSLHSLTVGPQDVTKPSWSIPTPDKRSSFTTTNYYCNPLIDSQRNVYNMTDNGELQVHRADGALQCSAYFGPRLTTPMMRGESIFLCSADGYAFRAKLGTLEVEWSTRYCQVSAQDTWHPNVSDLIMVVGGNQTRNQYYRGPGMWGNNWVVHGLDPANGSVKWVFFPEWFVYNINATLVHSPAYGCEVAIFTDSAGGVYILTSADGHHVWRQSPVDGRSFNDVCGVCYGPNHWFYNTYADDKCPRRPSDNGKFPQQNGIVQAFDFSNGHTPELKWTFKRPFNGMLQPAILPTGEGQYILILAMGENCASPVSAGEDQSKSAGHTWQGMLFGLEPNTGEEIWSFMPPAWKSRTGSCRASMWWRCYLPASWASPITDERGTVFVPWHGGIVYTIEGRTGRVLSSLDIGCCVTGTLTPGPGMLVAQAQYRVLVWKDEELEKAIAQALEDAQDPRAKAFRSTIGTCEEARLRGIGYGDGDDPRYAQPDPTLGMMHQLPTFRVVGGKRSGGVSVRSGADLKSPELPERLAHGARVLEIDREGDRLKYTKVEGEGPEEGWISVAFKGNELVQLEGPPAGKD